MSLSILLANDNVPHPIRDAFLKAPPALLPEEELFRSVAARATLDAIGEISPIGAMISRRPASAANCIAEARAWFRERPPRFYKVFELAGMDPGLIRALVLAYISISERRAG